MSGNLARMIRFLLILLLYAQFAHAQSFIPVAAQTDASFRGLSVVSDDVAWVSGSKGYVGSSTDGGKIWNFKQVKGFEKSDFRTLYAFDASTAIIANAGSPAYILYTKDAGESWTTVYKNEAETAFFDGIDFWNDKEGIIYGDPINGRMLLLYTNDGGKTWEPRKADECPALQEGEASFAASGTNIRCTGKNTVMIATGGTLSRMWMSEDKGKTWQYLATPILQGKSSTGIFSFLFRNSKHGVIVGGDYKNDTLTTDNAFYTTDGGNTWLRPMQPTRGYRECVNYIDKHTLLATGPTGTDISYNAGETWQPFNDEKQYHVIKKSRKGNTVIMAGAKGKIAVLKAE